VKTLVEVLGIPRSTVYYQPLQPARDDVLKGQIESVLANNPAYGHRRIAMALGIGKKRVRRVMKLHNLKPYKRKARWRKRRDERRPAAPYENHIKGICPLRPHIIYVCDFTYIRYRQRFMYLATYMDLYTREIVGWHVSATHTKDLVIEAFWDALMNTGQVPKIVHSDQGSEYTSADYTQFLAKLGIQISMSKKSSPWENAYQESYYNNFKTDLGLEFDRFEGVGELVEAIHHTITYYNSERIHTSLKVPPIKFRLLYKSSQLKKTV